MLTLVGVGILPKATIDLSQIDLYRFSSSQLDWYWVLANFDRFKVLAPIHPSFESFPPFRCLSTSTSSSLSSSSSSSSTSSSSSSSSPLFVYDVNGEQTLLPLFVLRPDQPNEQLQLQQDCQDDELKWWSIRLKVTRVTGLNPFRDPASKIARNLVGG